MLYCNKTSSHTIRERQARDRVLVRRMQAEGHKQDRIGICYGIVPSSDDGKLLVSGWKSDLQRERQAHTSAGDFSHLAGNPLILK